MSDEWLLFTKFCQQGPRIGSVIPSSRWVAREMLKGIDFSTARCVVELGAGTGPVTAELLQRAGARCRTVIVERDPDLCTRLRERFPGAEVTEADALDLDWILDRREIEAVDHIVCGLTLAWFSPEDQHTILDTSRRRLRPDGSFRQVTYMPRIHLPLYRRYFDDVQAHFVLRNVPPASVYVCNHPLHNPMDDGHADQPGASTDNEHPMVSG